MSENFWNTGRLSGMFLIAGTSVLGTGMIVLAARGEIRGLDGWGGR